MHRTDLASILHLIEVEERRLDLRAACTSMFHFCTSALRRKLLEGVEADSRSRHLARQPREGEVTAAERTRDGAWRRSAALSRACHLSRPG
jgi:hypothetical protein